MYQNIDSLCKRKALSAFQTYASYCSDWWGAGIDIESKYYMFWKNIRSRKLTNTCLDHIIKISHISITNLANFHHDSWEEKRAWVLRMKQPYVKSSNAEVTLPS